MLEGLFRKNRFIYVICLISVLLVITGFKGINRQAKQSQTKTQEAIINDQINEVNKHLKLHPTDHMAYRKRGKLYRQIKDYKKALHDLNKAISLADYDHYYADRANIRRKTGDIKGAIDDLSIAIEKSHGSAKYLNNRGCLYIKLNEYKKAKNDFLEAFDKSWGSDCSVMFNLAQTYELLGDREKALKNYHKASRIFSSDYLPEQARNKMKARLAGDWNSYKNWEESRYAKEVVYHGDKIYTEEDAD
ncbi:MAG TPA: tetratricopeptide repeat protein [Firmicutes bacterium]|nr:tetratricopeptide repeat protein [Bacillota bacterium]HOQ23885.1 hypothetical protein [Bacillota bacterium]HPT67136.1 hypothetical protein [Bacillota bacterium]